MWPILSLDWAMQIDSSDTKLDFSYIVLNQICLSLWMSSKHV